MNKQKIPGSPNLPEKRYQSIMSKNVTEFHHFLGLSHINERDIDWTINLRSYDRSNKTQVSKFGTTPQVYYKETRISQMRKDFMNKSLNNKNKQSESYSCQSGKSKVFNSGQFSQFVRKNRQIRYPEATVAFQTSLGNGANNDKENQKCQKDGRFVNELGKGKGKSDFPQFLRKGSIQKVAHIRKGDLETAFDGDQNYPKYSQKVLRERNSMNLEHFAKGRISLPGIAWHVGLRYY